ncbi:MAG: TMEM175 family protein [Pseudobdellovibrionaceae bacterium]
MNKNRLEAFSDGVIAIIITIMVLELKVPHGSDLSDLIPLIPIFLSYVLSFIYIGIYWSNHHHMLHSVKKVTGGILWANLHLLFWLSLVPFVTGWLGENHEGFWPQFLYGLNLLLAAFAYTILQFVIIRADQANKLLKEAVGKDWKGKISLLMYLAGMAASFYQTWISYLLYVTVALIWIVPDRRIEKKLTPEREE